MTCPCKACKRFPDCPKVCYPFKDYQRSRKKVKYGGKKEDNRDVRRN